MVSHSRDGELGAKLGHLLGVHIVRGSSSRGGALGLRALYRTVKEHGCSPCLTPDGPRGPAYEFKTGGVVLAQAAKVPVLPICFSTSKCWRLRSWDRTIIPKPFAAIDVSIGEAIDVPRSMSLDEAEAKRAELEAVMQDQLRRVEARRR